MFFTYNTSQAANKKQVNEKQQQPASQAANKKQVNEKEQQPAK